VEVRERLGVEQGRLREVGRAAKRDKDVGRVAAASTERASSTTMTFRAIAR